MLSRQSLRSDGPSSESAEAQCLPKYLTGIFREDRPWSSGGLVSFGGFIIAWGSQESVKVAGACAGRHDAKAYNLAAGIDAMCEQQIQGGVGNESVQVEHLAVLPEESARVGTRVKRHANHIASVVNADGAAVSIPEQRAEVLHLTCQRVGPQEGVKGCVVQVRSANQSDFQRSGKVSQTWQMIFKGR